MDGPVVLGTPLLKTGLGVRQVQRLTVVAHGRVLSERLSEGLCVALRRPAVSDLGRRTGSDQEPLTVVVLADDELAAADELEPVVLDQRIEAFRRSLHTDAAAGLAASVLKANLPVRADGLHRAEPLFAFLGGVVVLRAGRGGLGRGRWGGAVELPAGSLDGALDVLALGGAPAAGGGVGLRVREVERLVELGDLSVDRGLVEVFSEPCGVLGGVEVAGGVDALPGAGGGQVEAAVPFIAEDREPAGRGGLQVVVVRHRPQEGGHAVARAGLLGELREVAADGGGVLVPGSGRVLLVGEGVDVDRVLAVLGLVLVVIVVRAVAVVVADRAALVVLVVRVVRGVRVAVVVPDYPVAAARVLGAPLVFLRDLVLVFGGRAAVGAGDHADPLGAGGVPASAELVRAALVLDQDAVVGECANDPGELAAPGPDHAARLDEAALAVTWVQGRVPRPSRDLDLETAIQVLRLSLCSGAIQHAADHAHRT
ncbi:hypothetical protein SUDANB91_07165 (plasmid) [Streptomyces sp. SudanB91_2054]